MKIIYNEDFKDFPLGEIPYDKKHSALGEYHTIIEEGYFGNWYDPIKNHQWRNLDGSFIVVNIDNKRYMMQNRGNYSYDHFKDVSPLLVLKNKLNAAYTFSFKIRNLNPSDYSGVVFNYITSRNFYSLSIKENEIIIYKKDQNNLNVLCKKEFIVDEYTVYNFKLVVNDNNVLVYSEDDLLLECNIKRINSRCGLISKSPCLYTDIFISMDDEKYLNHLDIIKEEENKLNEKRKKYSKIELIKKINLSNAGSARQYRIAHKKNKEPFFIFAQHQKLIMRDAFANISCLTAIDLDGNILWQIGEPNNSDDNTRISADLPFQVCDINNDGIDEIIYSKDFYVYIIDALTGKEIKKMKTPVFPKENKYYPYKRLNVDCIRTADFEGLGYKGGFILKDRYKNVFAYDSNMNFLWRYNYKNTGHFPYIYDFDNDGKDEMFVGYSFVSSDGKIKWSIPIESDHTDEIIYINTLENEPKRLYLASGNEGFNVVNLDGETYKHIEVGHAQRISIADYDKEKEGLEICVTSFWGANDIIYMFDAKCNKICEKEFLYNGNVVSPLCYDGENMLLLSNPYDGILDNELDSVILLPEDGHPYLCFDALDIDGDGVSEILCWDQYNMYIYKASVFKPCNIEAYDDSAMSNYRGEYIVKK